MTPEALPSEELAQAFALAMARDPAIDQDVRRLAKSSADEHTERALGYLGDPEKHAFELQGSRAGARRAWTRQQRAAAEEAAEAILEGRPYRCLALGGHATGKSHWEDDLAIWAWDVAGRRPRPDGSPQGADLIVTAPKFTQAKRTSYYQLYLRGQHAERQGHMLPGWAPRKADGYRGASSSSVSWWEGPWRMMDLTAKATADKDVAHSAGGTHHPYLNLFRVEEAAGIIPELLSALAGLAASQRVAVLAATNPTSLASPFYGHVRQNSTLWTLESFSQAEHPNVVERREVIPGAVSHLTLEAALRSHVFEDRGPAESTGLDPGRLDFVYALPPPGVPDKPGPRPDDVPGHPDGEPRVYRPTTAQAAGQHLGAWLEADPEDALFHVAAIAARMALATEPDGAPDQVGVDCAPRRAPWACARWGPAARDAIESEEGQAAALRTLAGMGSEAQLRELSQLPPGVLAGMLRQSKGVDGGPEIRLSRPVELRWAGGDDLERAAAAADHLIKLYGTSPSYLLDQAWGGGVGAALRAKGAKVELVMFGDPPTSKPLEAYGNLLNRRAEMYAEAAAVLNPGLAVLPYSQVTLDQMRALGALELAAGRSEAKKLPEKAGLTEPMDGMDAIVLSLARRKAQGAGWGRVAAWSG